jgi:two-component system, NtrC family, response regulator HydG
MPDSTRSAYWKTVIDTMADGLMIVDRKGVILSVNAAMETLTGYPAEELIGRSCHVLDCDTCSDARTGEDGHFCSLFRDGTIRRCRCTLKQKDGAPLHVMKNASILRNAAGEILGGVENFSDLRETVAREILITNLRQELNGRDGFHGLIGEAQAMQGVYGLIASAARSEAPVIIYGESGTGKELAAQAVHDLSPRAKGPLVKVNCAALNESLLETELFGHVKGAFTGADRNRVGRFEAAHRGDIFLDEIGEIPPATQVKLLRVLQEKEIERVGTNRPIRIDVRIISATNQDLKKMAETGGFREDLFYRIGVIPIHLPPLRGRREDIPRLVNAFMHRIRLKTEKPITGMSDAAMAKLYGYPWPGNVRELINAIEYAFVLCPGGIIEPSHLPPDIGPADDKNAPAVPVRRDSRRFDGPDNAKQRLLDALDQAGGNKSEAARILGISRVYLYKQLKKYEVRVDRKVRG